MTDAGDYYTSKAREADAAWEALRIHRERLHAARIERKSPAVLRLMEKQVQKAQAAYDRAAYVGD